MITSNKIAIGLLATILILTFSVLLNIRFGGKLRLQNNSDSKIERVNLNEFSHLELSNFNDLKIIYSDSNYLEINYYNDSSKVNLEKEYSGDSLKLKITNDKAIAFYKLHILPEIKKIIGFKSSINVENFKADSIDLNLHDCHFRIYSNNENEGLDTKKIVLKSINSNIYFSNTRIETIDFNLKENSYVEIQSYLTSKMNIEKDETSRINMN